MTISIRQIRPKCLCGKGLRQVLTQVVFQKKNIIWHKIIFGNILFSLLNLSIYSV